MVREICEQTNRQLHRTSTKIIEPILAEELLAFIGIMLASGRNRTRKLSLNELWTNDSAFCQPFFTASMSRDRFITIFSQIRFDDKETRQERIHVSSDKLEPIRTIFNKFVEECKRNNSPSCNITVDERLATYRGNCPFRVYMKSKPGRYGIKIGVTTDNFFTSVALADNLLDKGLTLTGTLRKNKREIPKEFLPSKHRLLHSSLFGFTSTKTLVSEVSSHEEKKPEIIMFYNKTKGAEFLKRHNGQKYNTKCPAVKRLLREAAELGAGAEAAGSGGAVGAQPLADNLFEWHFTVRGPADTEFAGGLYHGRILLPSQYPMRPPHIILLTPNGRFEVNRKICLSISGHHPETWQPSWSIRTALLALQAFLPTPAEGTIGSLDYSPAERRSLARRSRLWRCDACGPPDSLLLPPTPTPPTPTPGTSPSPCCSSARPSASGAPSVAAASSAVACPERLPRPPSPSRLAASPPRDSLDSFRDCVVVCLIISIAIFVYRRFNLFSYLDLLHDY
ncbi:uncharacterized protein LOC143921322 [Arctopsyche grandis]|uniref:uncharacterized protein LOC143921322 n=1 Tax=Arctopsyche grandis TaxID=121162 RepID=UPI00406D73C2